MKTHITLSFCALALVCQGCVTIKKPVSDNGPTPAHVVSSNGQDIPKKAGVNLLDFEEIELVGDFSTMTDFKFLPHSNEFLALARDGHAAHFRIVGKKAVQLGDFDIPGVFIGSDCGAISLVLDPDFDINKLFYVSYCTDLKTSTVSRYKFDPESYASIPYSKAEIITLGDPTATRAIHAVGGLVFDNDGNLLVSFGDKGMPKNAQDPGSDLGKVLRIVPNRDANGSGYRPAENNPAVSDKSFSPDVYAMGFRNPWRMVLDRFNHLWVADVGSVKFEELNLVVRPGSNFGWGKAEGPCTDDSCKDTVDPTRYYNRDADHEYILDDPAPSLNTKFRLMWVGKEYDSDNDRYEGKLKHKVLYGDWCMGWIRAIQADGGGQIVSDEQVGHLEVPVAWDIGPDGYLYAGTMFTDPALYCFDSHGDAEETYGASAGDVSPADMKARLWRAVLLTE